MSNLTLKYLDHLPQPDKELCYAHLGRGDAKHGSSTDASAKYQRYSFNEQLNQWFLDNIVHEYVFVGSGVSIVDGGPYHRVHTDITRVYTLNYLFETGGTDVITSFYQEKDQSVIREPGLYIDDTTDLELIESFKLETGRWHVLNTRILHGVTGLVGPRIGIQIGLRDISHIR